MQKQVFPEFSSEPGDWILACPDFPGVCISHKALDTKTWRNSEFIIKAKELTELQLQNMYANGDTIPSGQDRLPDYFSFTITVPNREDSYPLNKIPTR